LMNSWYYFVYIGLLFALAMFYFKVAKRYRIIDLPNHRTMHKDATIRGGGIIIFFGVLAFSLFVGAPGRYFMTGLFIIGITGLLDDIMDLSSSLRFPLQVISIFMILAELDKLQSGGSTAGGAGLKLAYKVAQENFAENGNNRIILATDGDFNVGSSSNAEMERLIEEKREHGVFMTVLGFGMGNYKDDKMEIIADKGNGNYSYIDNIQEARKVFITEFGGTLFTIAKDVKFQMEFNPARVKGYRLVGYENRLLNDEDFNNDKKDAGEMGAGHTVTALYEIIPAGSDESLKSIDPLKYQSNRGDEESVKQVKADPRAELMTVKLRYKQPDGNTSTKVEIPVKGKVLDLDETSDNFRFSAAIAEFGLILRNSEYKEDATMEAVIAMAKGARGEDEEGYRSEFLKLVKLADSMAEWSADK